MIWATVSSQSCFCWLYRASPSLAAKNIISLILVLTIWWCPCVVFSCAVGRGCLLWPMYSLVKTLLAFDQLPFVFQGQIWPLLPTFAFQSPIMKRTSVWGVSSRSLVGLHRTIAFQLLQHYSLGHRPELLWYWMAFLGNEQRSFCHFWDCIWVLHFELFLWTMMATPFLLRDSCPQ